MKNSAEAKKGRGRPRATNTYGERHSATITMRPGTKARLKTLAVLKDLPPWRIIEEAIEKYIEALEPKDRNLVEPLAKRAEAQAAENSSSRE